jgi:isocitrate/isopropylmalate dehydrogenase
VKASDFIVQQCAAARREGALHGLIVGCIVGLGIMLGVHVALSMHADTLHDSLQASIREADAILGGDGSDLKASVTECHDLVVRVSEDTYANVRDYARQIDDLQKTVAR